MRKGDSADKETIRLFVKHLRLNGNPRLKVHSWPDSKKSGDIDAIAGPFAIEHTSIDTLPNQRERDALFLTFIRELKHDFNRIPYRLKIIFAYTSIIKRKGWVNIRNALKQWITDISPNLPDGKHDISDVPMIPFDFMVFKNGSRRPGLSFGRFDPKDTSLAKRLKESLPGKVRKLSSYKRKRKTTILLVESDDVALMDISKMFDAINEAFDGALPESVDQVWYADTSTAPEMFFHDFISVKKHTILQSLD